MLGWLHLLDFLGHRLQVFLQRLFEQAALIGMQGFGFGRKLQPLKNSHLVRELVQQGLLVLEIGGLLLNQLALRLHCAQQPLEHLAQLRLVHVLQIHRLVHGGIFAEMASAAHWHIHELNCAYRAFKITTP